MAYHIEKGKSGELLACEFLVHRHFDILHCNWKSGHHEIDIIATKNNTIHFIEVKTRHSNKFGFPEEAVTPKKFDFLKNAAAVFLNRYKEVQMIQFDILSITRIKGEKDEYFFIEDVYMD